MSVIVSLLRLGLVGFSTVSRVSKVRVSDRIRVSLVTVNDMVGVGVPGVEREELVVGNQTCSHSHYCSFNV